MQRRYIEVEPGRPLRDIFVELRAELGGMIDEYFDIYPEVWRQGFGGVLQWPDNIKWIACYAVTGGSEGHYIHVDLIDREGRRTLTFLGKTFQGMAHAQAIANRCAELLGA